MHNGKLTGRWAPFPADPVQRLVSPSLNALEGFILLGESLFYNLDKLLTRVGDFTNFEIYLERSLQRLFRLELSLHTQMINNKLLEHFRVLWVNIGVVLAKNIHDLRVVVPNDSDVMIGYLERRVRFFS